MKKINEVLLNMCKRAAKAMIEGETRDWPPECAFIIYQPERPVLEDTKLSEEENNR